MHLKNLFSGDIVILIPVYLVVLHHPSSNSETCDGIKIFEFDVHSANFL